MIFFDEKGPLRMHTEKMYIPSPNTHRAHISQLCPSIFICSPLPLVNAMPTKWRSGGGGKRGGRVGRDAPLGGSWA